MAKPAAMVLAKDRRNPRFESSATATETRLGLTARRVFAILRGMQEKKPYTHVRLILEDDGNLNQRYEVRVSTFVQFDHNAGRRAVTGHPSKEQAEEIAKEIARRERERTGTTEWPK